MTASLSALERLDDGLPVTAADRVLLQTHDEMCQRYAFVKSCPVCSGPTAGGECTGCVIAHDDLMRRADDV